MGVPSLSNSHQVVHNYINIKQFYSKGIPFNLAY